MDERGVSSQRHLHHSLTYSATHSLTHSLTRMNPITWLAGASATAALRILTSGLEEAFILDLVHPITAKMAMSIDISTTHPHIRVELARLLAHAMCVSGERTRFECGSDAVVQAVGEADDSSSSSSGSGLPASVAKVTLVEEPKDADVDQMLKLFQVVNTVEGVKAVGFLLGATHEDLIASCLAGLQYCSAEALGGLALTQVAADGATARDRLEQLEGVPAFAVVSQQLLQRARTAQ
jgi:hypothetical protein